LEERLEFARAPMRVRRESTDEDAFMDFVDRWEEGSSLLLTGKSGTGKSIKAFDTAQQLATVHNLSVRWASADQYIDMIKDSFDNDGLLPYEYSSPYLVKNIKSTFDVVVLDGLGDERLTEFAAHELGSLIRVRYDKMRTTIVTTRLSMVDLKARYGERLAVPLADFDTERM